MTQPSFSLYSKKLAFSVLGLFVFSLQSSESVSFSVLSSFLLMTTLGIIIDQLLVQQLMPVNSLEDMSLVLKKLGACAAGCLGWGLVLHFLKDSSGTYTGLWYAAATFLGMFANSWHNVSLDDRVPSMEETIAERDAFEARHRKSDKIDDEFEED